MKIIEKTFDAQTGEETIIEREETTAEKKDREKFEAAVKKKEIEIEKKQVAKQNVAEKLGLTADELEFLLG